MMIPAWHRILFSLDGAHIPPRFRKHYALRAIVNPGTVLRKYSSGYIKDSGAAHLNASPVQGFGAVTSILSTTSLRGFEAYAYPSDAFRKQCVHLNHVTRPCGGRPSPRNKMSIPRLTPKIGGAGAAGEARYRVPVFHIIPKSENKRSLARRKPYHILRGVNEGTGCQLPPTISLKSLLVLASWERERQKQFRP